MKYMKLLRYLVITLPLCYANWVTADDFGLAVSQVDGVFNMVFLKGVDGSTTIYQAKVNYMSAAGEELTIGANTETFHYISATLNMTVDEPTATITRLEKWVGGRRGMPGQGPDDDGKNFVQFFKVFLTFKRMRPIYNLIT